MTEPTSPDWLNLDELHAALERVAGPTPDQVTPNPLDLGGITMPDVIQAAHAGPHTLAIAEAILASPRALRVLKNRWTLECPTGAFLDTAVASPTATAEERTLAQVTHQLLTTLHTTTCDTCRERLETLTREMETMEDPDVVISRWTLHLTSTRPAAGVRGEDSRTPTIQLDEPGLYRKLAREPMNYPQPLTLQIQHDETTHTVAITLNVPGGMAPTVNSVTAHLTTSAGETKVPFDLSPREDDDVTFTATTSLPPGVQPDLTVIDIEVN